MGKGDGTAWPAIDIYTHATGLRCCCYIHTQDTRTRVRAGRPAHTVSPVYISEVPWPPPSVTTSYIPPLSSRATPGRLRLLLLLLLFFVLLVLLLFLHLPLSAQAFLICIPLRWHSSPPLDPPSFVSFAFSSPNDAIHPTTPLSVLRGFTHTRVLRPCITRTARRGGRSGARGGRREGETKRPPLTSAHGVRRPRDTK